MPSNFSVKDFIDNVRVGGLARVNRYEVTIVSPTNPGQDRQVSLYCELTNFASMQIQIKPYRIFGPSDPKPIYPEYGGMAFPMTFILDRDMQVKRYFDDWMHQVTNMGYFDLNYPAQYRRDIYIRQVMEGNDNAAQGDDGDGLVPVSYEQRLVQAFPHSMSVMELDHSNHNTIHRLQVLFAFRYWETTDKADVQGTTILHGAEGLPPPQVPNTFFGVVGQGQGAIAPDGEVNAIN